MPYLLNFLYPVVDTHKQKEKRDKIKINLENVYYE